jgi:hypothetical protein
MHQKVYTIQIKNPKDMNSLEQTLASLLGGEHNKCAFIRSQEFIALRLRALYGRSPSAQAAASSVVYGEGLKITLDPDNHASVYLVSPSIEADPSLLVGKRACPDSSLEEGV